MSVAMKIYPHRLHVDLSESKSFLLNGAEEGS